MSRILAYTSPARGDLYPAVPVLKELRSRGHEVALRTLASECDLMRSLGFDTKPIDPAVEAIEHADWKASNPRQALKTAVVTLVSRAEHDAADLRRAIEAERPDALLLDVNSWGALAVAEAWGGPWAIICPYPIFLSSPDAPPFGPGLSPGRGPVGRMRNRLLRPLITGVLEKSFLPALNHVRAEAGVPALDTADEMFLKPPLLIYMTAEPFEYPRRDWPRSLVMVGPCEWEPPQEAPDWMATLDHDVVLVTTSSEFQNDGRLVEAALEGLATEPFTVVATVPHGDPATYRVPANARVERWLPHGPLLDRCVCAITHGGMGATQKALARAVPVCVVPFGRDQLEVARRVEVAGAGSRLPADRLRPDRLRTKVREAIARQAGAKRIADAFRAAGGAQSAADAIESRLLEGDRARPGSRR